MKKTKKKRFAETTTSVIEHAATATELSLSNIVSSYSLFLFSSFAAIFMVNKDYQKRFYSLEICE